jgi:hypothetical protein
MTKVRSTQGLPGLDCWVDNAVSIAIVRADDMAKHGGNQYTVVRTKKFGVCIYHDYQLRAGKNEIVEEIYSTKDGFIYRPAA